MHAPLVHSYIWFVGVNKCFFWVRQKFSQRILMKFFWKSNKEFPDPSQANKAKIQAGDSLLLLLDH